MAQTKTRSLGSTAYLVGVVAWLIPGGGHWMLGMKDRGAVIFVSICSTFLIGMLLGSVFQVDPHRGHIFWYILQVFAGLPTIITTLLQDILSQSAAIRDMHGEIHIFGRGVDLGELYTRVAGLLNLMCILDALMHSFRDVTPITPAQRGKTK